MWKDDLYWRFNVRDCIGLHIRKIISFLWIACAVAMEETKFILACKSVITFSNDGTQNPG